MNRLRILSLILVLTILSCQKEEQVTPESPAFISMNFDDLEEGQMFKFTLLEAVGYSSEEYFDFSYTNDTLLLEIVSVDHNQITVKESISLGSNMLHSNEDYYLGEKDLTHIYTWFIENDSLITVEPFNSHLLPRSYFSLNIDTSCNVDINGWKTSFPFVQGDKLLYTTHYTLNDVEYDTLGIFLNNKALSHDGMGNTLFYNKKHGIVRTSSYFPWTDEGQGWDRIR